MAPAWAALLPQATVATFPEAGHLVLDESADASALVATLLRAGLTCRSPTSTSSRGIPVPALQQVIADISQAMADILGAPKERLEVWVTEIDPELWGISGEPASAVLERAPLGQVEMPFVQMALLAGRPKEQHHALIAAITAIIERVLGTERRTGADPDR